MVITNEEKTRQFDSLSLQSHKFKLFSRKLHLFAKIHWEPIWRHEDSLPERQYSLQRAWFCNRVAWGSLVILTKSSVNCIQIICIAHDEKMNVNRGIKSAMKPMRRFENRMMEINKIYLLQIFKRDSFCNSLCFFCEVVQVSLNSVFFHSFAFFSCKTILLNLEYLLNY